MTPVPSPAEHLSAENLAREALQRIAEMNPRESASYLLPAWRKAKGIARAAIVAMDAARSPAPEQPKAGEREQVGEAVELDNEALRFIGAVGRKVSVGKHAALHRQALKETVEALDAAGMSRAADTLIWAIWWRVLGDQREQFLVDEANKRAETAETALAEARSEVERLRGALAKIDAIRNSIVGCQSVNWSEHIYPLVAALGEAGYEGEEYEIARANIGTLIEQVKTAEALNATLAAQLDQAKWALERIQYGDCSAGMRSVARDGLASLTAKQASEGEGSPDPSPPDSKTSGDGE
jgi:hypothetical protein